MPEELIGGVKLGGGYSIYATTERVIGVRGGLKEIAGALLIGAASRVLGPAFTGVGVDPELAVGQQLSMEEATKTLEWLDRKKDFVVRRDELEEVTIRVTRGWKRWFSGSQLIFKTHEQTRTIVLTPERRTALQEAEMLKRMLLLFDRTKLRVEDK